MSESHVVGIPLSDDLLTRVCGGMNQPTRPDYRVDPRAMGGVMAADAATGALGGAAIGGIGAMPGAAGGALMAGAGYCVERLEPPDGPGCAGSHAHGRLPWTRSPPHADGRVPWTGFDAHAAQPRPAVATSFSTHKGRPRIPAVLACPK